MVHEKYLSFVLFILLFITSFLFNQGQETNNTKNETNQIMIMKMMSKKKIVKKV